MDHLDMVEKCLLYKSEVCGEAAAVNVTQGCESGIVLVFTNRFP